MRVGRATRWIVLPGAVLVGLAGMAICAAPLFADRFPAGFSPADWQLWLLGAPLALGAAWATLEGWRGRAAHSILSTAVSWAGAATLGACLIVPQIDPLKSARSLSIHLAALPERPSLIPCVGVMPEGFRYYSRLPLVHGPRLDRSRPDAQEFQEREFLALARLEGAQFLALVRREDWERWSGSTRAQLEIRHEQSVGLRQVLVIGARPPAH